MTQTPCTYNLYFFYNKNFTTDVEICAAAGEVVVALLQMYEANYPEILKVCYIINGKWCL